MKKYDMTGQEKMFRCWGEYFDHPQCCIDAFCERVLSGGEISARQNNHTTDGSGHIPCEKCVIVTAGMTKEEASNFIGHDIFVHEDYLQSWYTSIKEIQSQKFIDIAKKYDYDWKSRKDEMKDYVTKLEAHIYAVK